MHPEIKFKKGTERAFNEMFPEQLSETDKLIKDMIDNPRRWFDWWDRYPMPHAVLWELLYKMQELKDDRKQSNR